MKTLNELKYLDLQGRQTDIPNQVQKTLRLRTCQIKLRKY